MLDCEHKRVDRDDDQTKEQRCLLGSLTRWLQVRATRMRRFLSPHSQISRGLITLRRRRIEGHSYAKLWESWLPYGYSSGRNPLLRTSL